MAADDVSTPTETERPPSGLGRWLVGGAVLVTVLALGAAGTRVVLLERHERDVSAWNTGAVGAPLAEVVSSPLDEGDDAIFEVCGRASFEPDDTTAVRVVADGEELVTSTLGQLARTARTSSRGSCATLGGGRVGITTRYRIELPGGAELYARIASHRPATSVESALVVGLYLSAVATAIVSAIRVRRRDLRARSVRATWMVIALAMVGFLGMGTVLSRVIPYGTAWGLVSGLILAVAEVSIAIAVVGRQGALDGLGVARDPDTRRTEMAFPLALVVAVVAEAIARQLLARVPSTGEAPIEAFVSSTSGALSYATLAVIAPIAEELFFRGAVFGVVERSGRGGHVVLAAITSVALFWLAHLRQAWGNWGGVLAVAVAGIAFTLLRVGSRSTLPPIVAHLSYNALLAMSVLAS